MLLNVVYMAWLLARPQVRVQILKPDMGCFKSQLPPSFLAHEEMHDFDFYFIFILFLFYTLFTLKLQEWGQVIWPHLSQKAREVCWAPGSCCSKPRAVSPAGRACPASVPAPRTPDALQPTHPKAPGYVSLHHVVDHARMTYLLLSTQGWDELWNEESWECNREIWRCWLLSVLTRSLRHRPTAGETKKKSTPTEEQMCYARASPPGSKQVTASRGCTFWDVLSYPLRRTKKHFLKT